MASLRKYKWSGLLLGGFTLYFCFSALIAPFWGGNDTWSDLLPVVHYQNAILKEHRLPLYTEQWYGGREQWKNPLWNFLYLPATLIWLVLPLDLATKIILIGHLLFSLFAGWKLASLFITKELDRIFAAIIFVSPSLPAYLAGHIENILSWGWILLALYFLLDEQSSAKKRGLGSGICFGIIPLTGSNYYTFYGFILIIPLLLALKNKTILGFFAIGAAIGLLHLPSVAYMIGMERANTTSMLVQFRMNFLSILSSITIGYTLPLNWETWGCIGIGVIILWLKILWRKIKELNNKTLLTDNKQIALCCSLVILILFATGFIFHLTSLFDTFRIPARAIPFIALNIFLYCLMSVQRGKSDLNVTFYLGVSAIQIIFLAWLIRPIGSPYSYHDIGVRELGTLLKKDKAQDIWINNQLPTNMNIDIGLTMLGFNLPNVYYGDMGQEVPVYGNRCGYAFDHIITAEDEGLPILLKPNNEWQSFKISMPKERLELVGRVKVNGLIYKVYRVKC